MKDDDFVAQPGRELNVPANRPLEIQISSKDVIHDFFLPNFRVKLDAVPGIRGKISFTATKTSAAKESETIKKYTLEELATALTKPETKELSIRIDENAPGDAKEKDRTGWRYFDAKSTKKPKPSIIRNGASFPGDPAARQAILDKLKDAGITDITAYVPGYWDIVCEELCGEGHYTMQGRLVVLDGAEYDKLKLDRTPPSVAAAAASAAPTTAPAATTAPAK